MSQPKITELISAAEIQGAIDRLAGQLIEGLRGFDSVEVVSLLEGARRFTADLFERIGDPKFHINYLKASSYHGGTRSGGQVVITAGTDLNLRGRTVLLVDDIYDTGHTMTALIERLTNLGAARIITAVLLVKRRGHEKPVTIDYHALEIDDLFVVGYGLDYQGRYRDLDYIGQLKL